MRSMPFGAFRGFVALCMLAPAQATPPLPTTRRT